MCMGEGGFVEVVVEKTVVVGTISCPAGDRPIVDVLVTFFLLMLLLLLHACVLSFESCLFNFLKVYHECSQYRTVTIAD